MTVAAPTRLEVQRELIWRACAASSWYFISGYIEVNRVGQGYGKWDLEWEHQEDITEWMQEKWATPHQTKSGSLKARQIGWTTIAHAFALWDVFFHENHDWLSVSIGEDEAKDALKDKVKIPYERLPGWMRKRGPAVVTDTTEIFAFDNNSSIRAIPSTERSGRSRAVFGALFDEAAFQQDAEAVFAAVEPTVYGPLFVFSTANGMGDFFHDTWVESMADDSEWDMKFYPWDVVPGRDQAWYDRKKLGYRTTPHLFYQEYPSNPTEAFLKSGRTAFDIEHLQLSQGWSEPAFVYDVNALLLHKAISDVDERLSMSVLEEAGKADIELWVWRLPEILRDGDGVVTQEPNYAVGVDVSEGLAHGDYSALSVRNVNTDEQVATVRAHIPIYDVGPVAELLGYLYHTALVGVERNAFGLVPLQYLQDRGYPRLYRMDPIAELKRGQKTPRYGWLTTRTTKPKMVQDMVKVTVHDEVKLHDSRWLQEATTFISTGTGKYEASASNTDDLMMAELVTHQIQLNMERFPIVWRDTKPKPLTFGDVFKEMSYAGNQPTDDDLLDRPIGQPFPDPVSTGFRTN